MLRLFAFILTVMILVGCQPAQNQQQPIPTLIPSPTVPVDLESAERVARLYLDAWAVGDYDEMYRLISFNSQEAITLDEFRTLYAGVQETLTLNTLTYRLNTLQRQGLRVMLNYSLDFSTRLAGDFSDTDRELTLVTDSQAGDWRVAWSQGDIFAEMRDGARLVLDKRIPSRANIYDRDGVILADQNGIFVQITVLKEDMPMPEQCYSALADALNKPVEDVRAQFDQALANWEVEAGIVERATYLSAKDRLEQVCNATFQQKATRQYLRGSLMPHVLGNVGFPDEDEVEALEAAGFDAETIIGKSGVELSWDETLRGQPGGRLQLVAATGERIRVLGETPSQVSESLWLTIDSDLQEYVTQVIGEAYANASDSWARTSRGAAAVIMDVNTGEILAMVSWPRYEGNALNPYPAIGRATADVVQKSLAENPAIPQLNRVTQGVYPSGSTMKVVTSTAVLDSGVYTEETSYMCIGFWSYEGDVRVDWLIDGHGRMTTSSAITNSCNPFFYEAGFQLNLIDPFLLPSYARRMGLGNLTGMTDLAESPGTIPDPDWFRVNRGLPWSYSNAVNLAIGQGEVEVTPLQMVRMYAGIANGGTLYQPKLVRETGILNQRTFVAEPVINGAFNVDPAVLDIVREGMCNVTSTPRGTAAHIFRGSQLLTLGVCGKTGTAQDPAIGVPHSVFIAYAPKDDPQIAITVIVENSGDGSAISAPITRRILEYYFFDIRD